MDRRRLLVLCLVVIALVYVVAGGFGADHVDPADANHLDRSVLIQPAEGGSHLWPYTSRDATPEGRTLAINVIVHGPDDRVKRALTDRSALEFEEATVEGELEDGGEAAVEPTPDAAAEADSGTYRLVVNDSTFEWDDAQGAVRYAYVDGRDVGWGSVWMVESYQLHAGTYFGARYHVRAYTSPRDDWTALQIHQEYFDWFRLRHTVTDVRTARNVLERDFIDQPFVVEVRREYHGVTAGGNDGWITVIELLAVGVAPMSLGLLSTLGLTGILSPATRRAVLREGRRLATWSVENVRGFVVAGTLFALPVLVRVLGVAIEHGLPSVPPKAVVATLFPIVAMGPPVFTMGLVRPAHEGSRLRHLRSVSARIGGPVTPTAAFAFALVGLGFGFVSDFLLVEVTMVPIRLVLHRVGLAVAIGAIAAGTARLDVRGGPLLLVGIVSWAIGLVLPLLGLL